MELFIQQIANGLMMGSIYVLMALGLVLALNVLRVVNLAHGEAIMLGGFITFYLAGIYHLNFSEKRFSLSQARGLGSGWRRRYRRR